MANSLNTINVDGVTYDAAAYAESKKAEALSKNSDLDKNAFLKLLVTQLEHQDPLDPQDNSEFVAEMAQFSSLEQMTNMSESLTKINGVVSNMDTSLLVGQLSGMIGKGIDWEETISSADEEGKPVTTTENLTGVITGVKVADGVTKVIAQTEDGTKYSVDVGSISHVYEIEETADAPTIAYDAPAAAEPVQVNNSSVVEDTSAMTDEAPNPLDALETEMITAEA